MCLRILGYTGVTAKKEKQANKGKYSDVGSIFAIVVLCIFASRFLFICLWTRSVFSRVFMWTGWGDQAKPLLFPSEWELCSWGPCLHSCAWRWVVQLIIWCALDHLMEFRCWKLWRFLRAVRDKFVWSLLPWSARVRIHALWIGRMWIIPRFSTCTTRIGSTHTCITCTWRLYILPP